MKSVYNLLTKFGQQGAFLTGLAISLIFLMMVFGGLEEFSTLSKEMKGTTGIFNFGLYAAIGLTILGAIAMLAFGIIQGLSNPKGSMKGIIGLVVLAVVFIAAYSMANMDNLSERMTFLITKFDISPGVFKFISAAITTALMMSLLAFLAFVFSEVRNFFK